MQLNHLNLCVPNLSVAQTFFEKYFGFEVLDQGGQDTLCVMQGEDGFVLVLSNFERKDRHEYPRDFHVGFLLDSPDSVRAMFQRMKDDGVDIQSEPKDLPRGTTFYGHIDKTILFEIASRP